MQKKNGFDYLIGGIVAIFESVIKIFAALGSLFVPEEHEVTRRYRQSIKTRYYGDENHSYMLNEQIKDASLKDKAAIHYDWNNTGFNSPYPDIDRIVRDYMEGKMTFEDYKKANDEVTQRNIWVVVDGIMRETDEKMEWKNQKRK